jgi:hypothetical protein
MKNRVLLSIFIGKMTQCKGYSLKQYFLVMVGSFCSVKRSQLGDKRFAHDGEVETEIRKWLRPQSKDIYAGSFDAPVSMLVQDMPRHEYFLQVQIS